MNLAIHKIHAIEILDSRGNPTVAATVELAGGVKADASVPSGASTGRHEASELRDGDPKRYAGGGVLGAVRNVNEILAPALCGMNAAGQSAIDARMIEIDGSADKSNLGANAILAVSCAVARAAARALDVTLWRHLKGNRTALLPVPMINIFSGGRHARHNLSSRISSSFHAVSLDTKRRWKPPSRCTAPRVSSSRTAGSL